MPNVNLRNIIVDEWNRQILQNPADRVTVKSICEGCGISRQTFYYHFDDMADLLRDIMEDGGTGTIKRCRGISDVREGIRLFLSDFVRYLPVARRMKDSKYRDLYEHLVTENNRRLILSTIDTVYGRRYTVREDVCAAVDFLACGLTQTIMEHCLDERLDVEFIGALVERTLNLYLKD